jgi:hypothetical protein
MIVYTDVISGDEVLSSAFTQEDVLDAEGNVIEGMKMVQSKMISKDDNVDVGCGDAFGGGGDEVDSGAQMVNNVIDSFQFTETQLGTAMECKGWLKEYFNKVVETLKGKGKGPDTIKPFKQSAPGIAKFLITNFAELQFFLGPSFDPDFMVFAMYPEGATTPNFYYIMGGLEAMKF